MALLALFKRRQQKPKPGMAVQVVSERQVDDLGLPAPELRAVLEKLKLPELPSALPAFPAPRIEAKEEKGEVEKVKPEVKTPPAPEVPAELPALEAEPVRAAEAVPFIKLEDYRQIQAALADTKSKLVEFGALPIKLGEIRASIGRDYETVRELLEGVEKKLSYIDRLISA